MCKFLQFSGYTFLFYRLGLGLHWVFNLADLWWSLSSFFVVSLIFLYTESFLILIQTEESLCLRSFLLHRRNFPTFILLSLLDLNLRVVFHFLIVFVLKWFSLGFPSAHPFSFHQCLPSMTVSFLTYMVLPIYTPYFVYL